MANARLQQLLNQRSTSRLYSGGKIRLLTPANTSITSIAKQVANSELDVMQRRYNAGEVSNSDMRAFLEKTLNNPGINAVDKSEISIQLKEFDSRIVADQLSAAYKSAPDGSLQQLQAAQALSQYYKTKASTQQPGTPAYGNNMDFAAQYDNKVLDIQKAVTLKNRQNQRYILEQKVNAIQSGTSEKATAKAEMWKTLYDTAINDGDQTAANQYAANYQSEITNAQTLGAKEETSGEKKLLSDYMNSLVNDYHDGRINEQQYLQALADVAPRIDATGDYGLINSLNRQTDIVQKNLDKGGVMRGTTASGLPTVLGKGKAGGGSGVVTDWDEKDFNYSDGLRKAKDALESGIFNTQDYLDTMTMLLTERAKTVNEQIAVMEETARVNPNTKVTFNGKKTRVADVLDSLYSEQEKTESQAGAVLTGDPSRMALVEVAPGEFTKGGDVLKKGKAFATYELVDTNNMPKDEYVQDTNGVYHQMLQRERLLTPAEMASVYGNTLTVGNKTFRVRTDATSGNQYLQTGDKYTKVYKPGTADFTEGIPDAQGRLVLPEHENLVKQSDFQLTDEAKKVSSSVREAQKKAKEQSNVNLIPKIKSEQLETMLNKSMGTDKTGTVSSKLFQQDKQPNIIQDITKPITEVVNNVVSAKLPVPQGVTTDFTPAQNIGITPNTRINLPKEETTLINMPQLKVAQQPLQIAGTQTQTNKNLQNAGIKIPTQIQAPPKISIPKPQDTWLSKLFKGIGILK